MSTEQIRVQLPDGSQREVPRGATPYDIATGISPRLAAAVVVARVRPLAAAGAGAKAEQPAASGPASDAPSEDAMYSAAGADEDGTRLVDLAAPLEEDVELWLLKEADEAALRVLRHSAAHVMATAILELFPETKLGHGPATDNGFFYDVYRQTPFTEADLAAIEARMAEVVARDESFVRVEESRDAAIADYTAHGEFMKLHFIERFTQPGDAISLYRNGSFTDFCRGPHIPSTGRVKAFKITSIAGAYWLGDEKNQQLQRIYGTAFFNTKDLDAHFKRLEEIKARDHRVLGKQLDLFSIQEVAGAGLIFWHPKGGLIRKMMEDWMREECVRRGYDLVFTPHIMRRELWKISGHEGYYNENMYPPMELDDAEYRLKPMNCPGHILIYKSSPRSYRDLPLRYAELGNVYRYERSGTMHGLLRVRGFTQDDAHIFCTPGQIEDEVVACIDFAQSVLKTFGFSDFKVELSTWDPAKPTDYTGDAAHWDQAIGSLKHALERRSIPYRTIAGEAAFYGPKIDIKLVDVLGRLWQLSTVQFDFNLPARFDLTYKGEDGELHQPVMVHRALFGSVERFFGVLIEHYAGAFPLWLAPVQVGLVPISSDKHLAYAEQVKATLEAAGLRVELDARNEKMNAKIRDFGLQKLPFILILGDKEASTNSVSVRTRGKGDEGNILIGEFIARAKRLISTHSIELDARFFGPLARKYLADHKWSSADCYPGSEALASELESMLALAEDAGVLNNKYLPKLLKNDNQRDEALSELRAALFFHQHGFRVFDWEPKGEGGKVGEFRIQRAGEPTIFVEVKSPGWESQINDEETRKVRSKEPKSLLGIHGSAVGTWEQLRDCIRKNAYGKFTESDANLLVVTDDFKPPLDEWMVNIALYETSSGYGDEPGFFTSTMFKRLGGIAVLQCEDIRSHQLRYSYKFYANSNALVRLPPSLATPDD